MAVYGEFAVAAVTQIGARRVDPPCAVPDNQRTRNSDDRTTDRRAGEQAGSPEARNLTAPYRRFGTFIYAPIGLSWGLTPQRLLGARGVPSRSGPSDRFPTT